MPKRRRAVASGPGGAESASQDGTSAPDARPPTRARRWLSGLVVTPTFFAGACIVLAAALAYGTTQTHLAFRGLGPICAATSCSATGQGTAGVPDRASARPEHGRTRRAAPAGGAIHPAQAIASPRRRGAPRARPRLETGSPAGGSPARTYSRRLPVIIVYRTVRTWPGGFLGLMSITNRTRSAIPNWLLWVGYRRARVDHVWGARWYPAGRHVTRAGLVVPRRSQFLLRPAATVHFTFRASGHPGPPGGCFFNATRCRFRHAGGSHRWRPKSRHQARTAS